MVERKTKVTRETKETSIRVELNIDGSSQFDITTGIRFFDHMLSQIAQHGIFDLKLSATGQDQHHVVEDAAICLGRAFNQALGNRKGIVRMANATVPMDDTLAMVALDIGGRSYTVFEANFDHNKIEDMSADLVRHFFISFSAEAKLNIHAKVISGINDHHKAESLFKALARTLDSATRIDERITSKTPSTKEKIET